MTDLEAHKSSFETLVNKAGKQCKRTLDYLDSKEQVDFYDAKGNKKVSIRKKDYSQVYSFCVSIDDFNVFAAHAEKVKYVKLRSGTISLSVNDLWVYSEYFKSSIKFIHFLKQRAFATTVPELALRDELDHLGYIFKIICILLRQNRWDKVKRSNLMDLGKIWIIIFRLNIIIVLKQKNQSKKCQNYLSKYAD